jgi:O-glycosyl hydrolase
VAYLFLAAALSAAGLAAQVLDLPPVPQDPAPGVRFHLSLDGGGSLVWGRGADIPRWFSREDLPALFSRTLWLDGPAPAGSSLDWIFTGDEGGFTVRILPGRVRLTQRYYDSYALNATRPPKARYPDKTWEETEVAYTGSLGSVTVTLDHKLGLLLSLNGKQAARQTCLLEARRYQLAWTPHKGATSGGVAGRVTAPEPVVARVRVDSARRHQTIYGFGGIMSFPAYARLSAEGRRKWWSLIQEYNLLIHREYPNGSRLKPDFSNFDKLEDATPHYYGDNFPNGEISDFAYSRRIQSIGGKVLFEYWQLPPWALREGKPIVSEYVRAMLAYCRAAKQKTGRAPEVLGIQNEIVQPAETWRDMILELRKALDREGFQTVRLHLPDNSNLKGGIATLRAIQQSPEAWKAIDYAATHVYDFQRFFEDPDGYDALVREWKDLAGAKPFLSTEFTVNHAAYQSSSYRTAFAQAQLYHKNMAMMDASALIYCWTLLDVEEPSFGATRSLFVPDRSRGWTPAASSYQARVFGAFSRRLREGMVRVDAVSDRADLLVTAYEGKAGARTAIAINRSTAPLYLSLDWAGPAITTAEIVSSYEENAPRRGVKLPITLQPGEIVTLTNVPLRRPVIVP